MGIDIAGVPKQYHGYQAKCVELLRAELDKKNLLYNELVMLVVPLHLWTSTGARYSDHDECETCAWLEKNTKFGEKSRADNLPGGR